MADNYYYYYNCQIAALLCLCKINWQFLCIDWLQ